MSEEDTDRSMPNADEVKGRAKQAAGAVAGNEDLEREGKFDRLVGDVKDAVDSVADKLRDTISRDRA